MITIEDVHMEPRPDHNTPTSHTRRYTIICTHVQSSSQICYSQFNLKQRQHDAHQCFNIVHVCKCTPASPLQPINQMYDIEPHPGFQLIGMDDTTHFHKISLALLNSTNSSDVVQHLQITHHLGTQHKKLKVQMYSPKNTILPSLFSKTCCTSDLKSTLDHSGELQTTIASSSLQSR